MSATAKAIVLERSVPGLNSVQLEHFVVEASQACGLRGRTSVLLTGDAEIRQLNLRFRGKDSATDVLSFPAAEANGFAGDIAISLDIATENARALGHSIADEIRILILHGILHLAGYDHENDRGEMERKESALRKKFGLATGLIERSSILPANSRSSLVGRRSSAKAPGPDTAGKGRITAGLRRTRT